MTAYDFERRVEERRKARHKKHIEDAMSNKPDNFIFYQKIFLAFLLAFFVLKMIFGG